MKEHNIPNISYLLIPILLVFTIKYVTSEELITKEETCSNETVIHYTNNGSLTACAFIRFTESFQRFANNEQLLRKSEDEPHQENQDCYSIFSFDVNGVTLSLCTLTEGYISLFISSTHHEIYYPLMSARWTRVCVLFSFKDFRINIYIDGRLQRIVEENKTDYTEGNSTSINQEEEEYEINHFCESNTTKLLEHSLEVMKFHVALVFSNVSMSNCTEIISDDLYFVSSNEPDSDENYCKDEFTFVSIKNEADYQTLVGICQKMQGTIISADDAEIYKSDIIEVKNTYKGKNQIFTWLHTSGITDFISWCSVLMMNGTVLSRPCNRPLESGLCRIPAAVQVRLYGPITLYDRNYTLMTTKKGEIYLQGHLNSYVKYNNERWELGSNYHTSKCHVNSEAVLPFVRLNWTCKEETVLFAFSTCALDEFACDSGVCLPEQERCNGVIRCEDESDEYQCQNFILPSGYNINQLPPLEEGVSTLDFSYSIAVYAIDDIKTSNFYADVDMAISLMWQDSRLDFMNTVKKLTIDCSEIWSPDLLGQDDEKHGYGIPLPTTNKPVCSVISANKQEKILTDSYMGRHAERKTQFIAYSIFGIFRIPCRFNLRRYPFDNQRCLFNFYIKTLRNDIKLQKHSSMPANGTVLFTGRRTIGEFQVDKTHCKEVQNNFSASLYIELKGFYGYHFLNSFATSLLIVLISFITFFFRIGDFNERIMVSLTSLLVLTALFTQAISTSISTPYLKLLDIWYAVLITFTFLNVVMNTILNSQMHRLMNNSKVNHKENHLLFVQQEMRKRSYICFAFLMSSFCVFLLIFFLAAANVI